MKDFVAGIAAVVGVFGVMLLGLVAIAFYAIAFEVGAEEWFGWEGWWVITLFLAVAFIFRGGLVLSAGMVVGGYGAYYVWDWPIWIVVPVFFPGLAFMIAAILASVVSSAMERVRG